jgi:hypothetical protein
MNCKSDTMLYTNISWLHFKDKRENDQNFMYQMNKTQPACLMNRDLESKMWKDTYTVKIPFCSDMINSRGNNIGCVDSNNACPKPVVSSYLLNEWLLVPCAPPTHRNYLIQDDKKICSKQHQFFKNITKRKDIT